MSSPRWPQHGRESPELVRLGWRSSEFEGITYGEVLSFLDESDHLLLMGTDPIPPGWPQEVRLDRDDSYLWQFQDVHGEWRAFTGDYFDTRRRMEASAEETEDATARAEQLRLARSRLALVYSRNPVAKEHVRIRPILWLLFDDSLVCLSASGTQTDIILLEMLGRGGLWQAKDGIPRWATG